MLKFNLNEFLMARGVYKCDVHVNVFPKIQYQNTQLGLKKCDF